MADAAAVLREATVRLVAAGDTPRLDAELLMAHAAGIDRDRLLLDLRDIEVPSGFAALVERRLRHEPIAYILGYRDFWTVRIRVGPGVLIPRADSETLIAAAVDLFGKGGPDRILDLGCGPGTLLLAALDQWRGASGVGLERSDAARSLAQANVAGLGMAGRVDIVAGDWTQPGWVEALAGRFDLILANPPYVANGAALDPQVAAHEPGEALYAGPDGLDDYRAIMPALPALLAPGGRAIVELGAGQAYAVTVLAQGTGLVASTRRDLGGRDRALVLGRP